jgi:hypothetical protein
MDSNGGKPILKSAELNRYNPTKKGLVRWMVNQVFDSPHSKCALWLGRVYSTWGQ